MNTRKPARILTSSIAALAAIASFSPSSAEGAGGSWNVDAAGNWSLTTNWTPVAVPGTAAGDVINFTNALTAARIVTIDTTSRSAGDLNIGSSGAFGFTLASSATTVVLNLDGTGAADATVDFTANANTISAPITLLDNGIFRSNLTVAQTLSGIISGAKTVTFNNDTNGTVNAATSGAGQFLVTGVNTYSLGTTISDVRVNVQTGATALGTGAVTIQAGGQVFMNTTLTGLANTFNINGNGWTEAAGQLGAIRLDSGATMTGNVVMQSASALGSNSGTGTLNGVVSGAFALSKVGAGTLVLGGANTYAGPTTISAGILQTNNNTGLGTGAVTVAGATSRLQVNGGVTIANNVTINSGITGVASTGLVHQAGTGLARVNGTVTLNSAPTAGGTFFASNAVGSALVLGGAVNSTANLGASQRDGNVVFSGGGNATGVFTTTGTTLAGATNGIPQGWAISLGGSGNAALDLNGFDQTLVSASLGNAGANSVNRGSIALGAKTLTLNGDLSTLNTGTGNAINSITGTPGTGMINFGATARNISVADSTAIDDLQVSGTTLANTGGLTKTGAGTLALNGVTLNGAFTVSTGTVRAGLISQVGSFTAGNITFNGGTTLAMKVGTGADSINAGNFVNGGTTNLVLTQFGGALANGNYNLINYTGTSPGIGGFTLTPIGHATASLIDTGTAIALSVSGNDQVIWDGTNNSNWATGATGNWKLGSNSNQTDYIDGDDVIFQDGPILSTASIAANVTPSNVNFTNTTSTAITISGAAGIVGATGITKSGNGTVTLSNPNQYGGTTAVQAGTLVLDHTTATPLSTLSQINVSAGATTRFSHAGGTFALSNPISGAGTVVIDPSTTTAGNRDIATVNWNTTGFTGTLRLAPTTGTMRITVDNPTDLGAATVEVASGGQIFVNTASLTFANNISIAGSGFSEAAGFLGAIRASNPTTFTGTVTVNGSAKLGALGGTMNIANTLTGGALTFGGSLTSASSETLAITGNASGLTSITVNDGLATAGVGSIALNVGDATNTGTLGAVPVSLLADGFKNSIIRFTRTDGYTLGANITSTSLAANHVRTFVDGDAQGTGFSDGGFAINLGGSTSTTGGQFRVGTFRPNAISNITGALTAGQIRVGAGAFALATMNINSGAVVNAGNVHVGLNATATNSVLNINAGATVNASYLTLSELASSNGILNQNGGTVSVDSQVRVGHFGTETSTYNMTGGSLTLTGASPTLTPSTAGAGAANATGDNNINALAVAALVGGGIYVGVDGQGVFNHTGGTVTSNWIVLDNRGATGAGANMADGIDRYNISGLALLKLRSNWGFLGRNDGSYAVSFGGGTIQVDNTGTGTGTGANITIPLDAIIDTVAATTTTLDTAVGTNGFTLSKEIRGTGTLALAGGGAINLSTAGTQGVSASLSGANPVNKLGAGTTTLTGASSGYTGPITVSAGRLNVNGALGAASTITVADGATLSGEPTVAALTLGATTGSTLLFNPNTGGALTATTLNAPSNTVLDFSAPIPGDGTYQALSFSSKVGTGTFSLAGAANYRGASVIEGPTTVDVNIFGTKALVWLAAGGSTWDVNTTFNWGDSANANAPDKFFSADVVTFDDTAVGGTAVTVTAGVAPALVQVNGTTNNYTLTSTAAGIAGGEIVKDGSTTLTLVGPNTYPGKTTIQGGTVSIADPASLGGGGTGNTIALSNGGTLAYTGAVAANLGINRNIAIGTGGGTISHRNATAATITIPGNLSGTGALALNSTLAGGGTFLLSGSNNSAYTGAITVDSIATGISTLNFASQASVPNASSITLNYPAAGANGNATTLSLNGVSIPAATTLNMTSFLNGAISLRSQVTSSGNAFINGPITVSGTAIVQLSPANGTLTLNGPVSAGLGGFNSASSVFFIRGVGNGVVNAPISLPGGNVSKTDAGSWTINSTGNDWLSTGVLVGTVRMGANGALPAASNLVLGQNDGNTAVLALDGFSQTVGSLASNPTTVGANTTGKSITSTTPANLTVNQSTTTIYASVLTGAVALTKEGIGSLTISGVNSQTGATTINGGVLKLGSNTAMGTNTAVTIANGATLDVGGVANNAATRYILSVSGPGVAGQAAIWNSGGGIVNNPVYGTLNLTGDTSIGGIGRYDLNGGTGGTTVNGGTFTLTKVGANETWWAPNAGATVGNIVIDGGTFGVQSSNNLGSLAHKIIINSAGTLNTFGGQTNTKDIEINGGILATNNATNNWNGTITLSGTGTTNRVSPGAGLLLNLGGKVTGAQGFEKLTTGTVELQSALNDWQGDTKVSAGTLRVSAAGKLSTATTLDMNGGTVDLNGTAQTVAGLKGATGVINSVAAGSLVVNQSGNTVYGGTITGSTSLTKSGAGILELGGTSNTTGATLITGGVLRVSGSISGSAVTVNGATAVLGGIGTVGATTLLNGGTINAGASPGILNIAGNFTMSAGTTFGAEIDGTTVGLLYDQLNVTGTVTLADATLTLSGAYAYTGSADTFTLILNDGDGTSDLVSGTFAGLPGGASVFNGGQEFTINYAGGDGNDVVLTAVPEPGSAVMLLGGVGMLLGLRRRRNA